MHELLSHRISKKIFANLQSLKTSIGTVKNSGKIQCETKTEIKRVMLTRKEIRAISEMIYGSRNRLYFEKNGKDGARGKTSVKGFDLSTMLERVVTNQKKVNIKKGYMAKNGMLGFNAGFGEGKMSTRVQNWITEKRMEIRFLEKKIDKLKQPERVVLKRNKRHFKGKETAASAVLWRLLNFQIESDKKWHEKRAKTRFAGVFKASNYLKKKVRKAKFVKGFESQGPYSLSLKFDTVDDFIRDVLKFTNSQKKFPSLNLKKRGTIKSSNSSDNEDDDENKRSKSDRHGRRHTITHVNGDKIKQMLKKLKNGGNDELSRLIKMHQSKFDKIEEELDEDEDEEQGGQEEDKEGQPKEGRGAKKDLFGPKKRKKKAEITYFNDTFCDSFFDDPKINPKTKEIKEETIYGVLSFGLIAVGNYLIPCPKLRYEREQLAIDNEKEIDKEFDFMDDKDFARYLQAREKRQTSEMEMKDKIKFMQRKLGEKLKKDRKRKASVYKSIFNQQANSYLKNSLRKTLEIEIVNRHYKNQNKKYDKDQKDYDEGKGAAQNRAKSLASSISEFSIEVSTPSNLTQLTTPDISTTSDIQDASFTSLEEFELFEACKKTKKINIREMKINKLKKVKKRKKKERIKQIILNQKPLYCLVKKYDFKLNQAEVETLFKRHNIQPNVLYKVDLSELTVIPKEEEMDDYLREMEEMDKKAKRFYMHDDTR